MTGQERNKPWFSHFFSSWNQTKVSIQFYSREDKNQGTKLQRARNQNKGNGLKRSEEPAAELKVPQIQQHHSLRAEGRKMSSAITEAALEDGSLWKVLATTVVRWGNCPFPTVLQEEKLLSLCEPAASFLPSPSHTLNSHSQSPGFRGTDCTPALHKDWEALGALFTASWLVHNKPATVWL